MNFRFETASRLIPPLFVAAFFLYTANAEATLRSYALTRRPIVVTLTSGTSWTVPAGVTKLSSVECWGGGGGAAGSSWGTSFGGGGGGAYAKKVNLSVTPGASISYSIGAGGTSPASGQGVDGGDTWFVNTTTVRAKGGKGSIQDSTNWLGGAGGASATSVGDVVFAGGNGGNTPADTSGAGGGASGSPAGAGANGTDTTVSVAGNGGSANKGGAGGTGGAKSGTPVAGTDGTSHKYGGGGGGGGGAAGGR